MPRHLFCKLLQVTWLSTITVERVLILAEESGGPLSRESSPGNKYSEIGLLYHSFKQTRGWKMSRTLRSWFTRDCGKDQAIKGAITRSRVEILEIDYEAVVADPGRGIIKSYYQNSFRTILIYKMCAMELWQYAFSNKFVLGNGK